MEGSEALAMVKKERGWWGKWEEMKCKIPTLMFSKWYILLPLDVNP